MDMNRIQKEKIDIATCKTGKDHIDKDKLDNDTNTSA